jgi:hypothetical protein
MNRTLLCNFGAVVVLWWCYGAFGDFGAWHAWYCFAGTNVDIGKDKEGQTE